MSGSWKWISRRKLEPSKVSLRSYVSINYEYSCLPPPLPFREHYTKKFSLSFAQSSEDSLRL